MLCRNFFGYIHVASSLGWLCFDCTRGIGGIVLDKTSTLEPSSVVIIVSRVFSRRKRFRTFPQPASVPRKRPFPESLECFPRPSIYGFVKAKLVSTLVFKCENTFFHSSLG